MANRFDLDERLARHERFWAPLAEGEGAYVCATAPLHPRQTNLAAELRARWLDVDLRVRVIEDELESTYFGGDSVPVAQVDFGPGILPALLGRPYRVDDVTVWFDEESFDDPSALDRLTLERDGAFYRAVIGVLERLRERSPGRYVVASPDLGGTLDVLAALYRRESLLEDIVLEPERVQTLLRKVYGWWAEATEEVERCLHGPRPYRSTWIPVASEKRYGTLLSELAAMVSPQTFADIVLPALNREASHFDRVLFNIDGDAYARHLAQAANIRGLHAIEWDPNPKYTGPGCAQKDFASEHSIEVCREIQKHVKLILNGVPPEQADAVMKSISHDGVFLIVHCDSVAQAEEFLGHARKWTRRSN